MSGIPNMVCDRALVAGRLDLLYDRDARGRLLRDNEPGSQRAAPLVHVSAGGDLTVCAARHDVSPSLNRDLQALARRHADPVAPPSPEFVTRLQSMLGASFAVGELYAGPAFRFAAGVPAGAGTVTIGPAQLPLLGDDWGISVDELTATQPCAGSVVGGRVVSVCQTVRRSGSLVEAGLDTLPAFRRQGHGTRALLHWVTQVRARGLEPLYSASWDNTASCGLAASLGLSCYGTDLDIRERTGELPSQPIAAHAEA